MQETLQLITQCIQQKEQIHHTVVNAGKIVALQKDLELRQSVNEADLINADGQAVIWASNVLGKPLKERVAGIDLFTNLLALAKEKKYKVYLLGAKQEVLNELIKTIKNTYGSEIIAGQHHGYFSTEEEAELVENISKSGANMLFVAMSSPKKEIFLHKHKKALKAVNFIMGVGGSFDVISGKTKRAPLWMQDSGLEWFYRFIQEPRRMWKRYLIGNTKFISLVLKEKLESKDEAN
ncbi:WecB/TagA/CpsF family glycosyltransferase [Mesonia aquimarina]|uniref:WecB/TagA/CpsF family glycosyltransferase n=1 Tax=Mesonia aquimarina TaxID=1504967 RepID=UPI001F091868|nr:WecB/TagA/CpsF family glycosyltransferase [Mesonia aquimarina]